MEQIAANIISLRDRLPEYVSLIAVSKTRAADEILQAYNAGHRLFGENRVQELASKRPLLPDDIHWHLIGHLQTNKVRQAVQLASMIQSVDSFRLLSLISDEACRINKIIDCLIQVHIAGEETKSGFYPDEVENEDWNKITASAPGVRIRGLMGIATFTENEEQVRSEFRSLSSLFRKLKDRYFSNSGYFDTLSMGMSGDWKIAVEEGSTMIRVGTIIFGERIYNRK